jgi:hypothetical protein
MATLWLVKIHEEDWDYDFFDSAVVWADTAEQAEQIIRDAPRYDGEPDSRWIQNPDWRLHVEPANTEGVALVHWHAG